jgi:filamentous hemagglutinin family protein
MESYMKYTKRFSISPVSAAVALALGMAIPSAAFAAGMPGLGTVTVGYVTASTGTSTGGAVGKAITGLTSGATLTLNANSVVQWGGNTTVTDTNPAGFNLSPGSVLNVTGTQANLALLNVDASGNPSVIAGTLQSLGTKATQLFIANANGITLTSTGTIAAPYVALIGANLAVGNTGGVPTAAATSAQAVFGTGGYVPVTFANGNGNITVQGAIVGVGTAVAPAINNTNGLLIAGSGSVNVDFTNVKAANNSAYILGGTSAGVTNKGVVNFTGTNYGFGSATTAAPGYFATNVTLNNASVAGQYTTAYGNLTFTGNSVLSHFYDWKGTLSNTGSLQLANNTIAGQGSNFQNSWYDTPNATGTGFVQGQVGAVNNSGTLTSGGSGLSIYSNGFTNTGTLNLQAGIGNALFISSGTGDINLGGVVQTNNSQAAIESATLFTGPGVGNINVSAPLTIGNSGANNVAFFIANAAKGNVSITGAMTLTNSNLSSTLNPEYSVTGNNITIGANQTITNVNGTTSKQPEAALVLNGTSVPGTVTIGAGSTLKAGDVFISGTGTNQSLVNLVADGNITATNTTDNTLGSYGRFSFTGNNISGAGAGTITAQVFDLDVLGSVRKSAANLTNNYWTNGLVLTSAGANPTLNLYSHGPARQFLNLRVAGNVTVNSATSHGASFTSPALSGTNSAGDPNPNRMSQLMLMSTGNITIAGGGIGTTTGQGPGPQGGYFFFPGLAYFGSIPSLTNPNAIGTGSITAIGDVNNSVAVPVAGGQGLYFMTNNLSIGGSIYTNYNSYVNFANATQAAANKGVIYRMQPSPSNISNTLNMQAPTMPDGTPLDITNVYTIPTSF